MLKRARKDCSPTVWKFVKKRGSGPTVQKIRRASGGFSLLEVVMASTLSAIALVGALALLRDGMELSQTIDKRLLLTNYAVSKLEEQQAIVANGWVTGTISGDFSADGHSDIRFTVTRSDAVVDGGIVDRLMHLQVTTYDDADGDDLLDSEEDRTLFRTKIGKILSYESL